MSPIDTKVTTQQAENDRRILELLAQTYPDISSASTEIINLEAILNLPKGTEHFVADLHGEHEAFRHILKNASGNIKRKVTDIYGTSMRENEIRQLCSLIYYPEEKMQIVRSTEDNMEDFYNITLHQLIKVCQSVSSKYTRSKVRKALPKEFAYIIEELLHEERGEYDKQDYFNRIIETIISTGQADAFIVAMCKVIQKLSIDQLHILGDVWADLIVVAPATANFIAKLRNGICDDLLSSLCAARKTPIIVAPAMNCFMWDNPANLENIEKLQSWPGVSFSGPEAGIQACGDNGKGRLKERSEEHTSELQSPR